MLTGVEAELLEDDPVLRGHFAELANLLRGCDVPRHRKVPDLRLWVRQCHFRGGLVGPLGAPVPLVVEVRVQDQLAQELSPVMALMMRIWRSWTSRMRQVPS
jgi:hypothetical protein